MTPAADCLVPVVGQAYEHPRGRVRVLRCCLTEWVVRWDGGPYEQVGMREWRSLARSGLRRVSGASGR